MPGPGSAPGLNGPKNSRNTIVHVKIALPLGPIAQDAQMIRMFAQLAIEIENVSMGVALAQNRDKAKDVTFETESFTIGLDQPFPRHLRRSIQGGLNRERTILRCWDHLRLAIDRSGRRKSDSLDLMRPHRLEDVERSQGVLLQIFSRMFQSESDVSVRRKMKHRVAPRHRLGKLG